MNVRRPVVWLGLAVLGLNGCLGGGGRRETPPSARQRMMAVEQSARSKFGTLHATLRNGLTVLIRERHAAPVVAVAIYVKTGSVSEQHYQGSGVSHLLEHLVSGGTTSRRTEAENERLVDAIGGHENAWTWHPATCYHITTAARHVDLALELLSDWVMNSRFTQQEFDRELAVVTREQERRDANPAGVCHDLLRRTLFRVHPIRHPVIGYPELRAGLTTEATRRYYQWTYVPGNLIVGVVGDVNARDVLRTIRRQFAEFPRQAVPTVILPEEPSQQAPRRSRKELGGIRGCYLSVGYRTVRLTHPDLYPLDLIAYILGRGGSSRLVQQLRDEKQLVLTISAYSATPGYDAGHFGIYARLADEKFLPAAETAIIEELNRLKTEDVTEAELARAKAQAVSMHLFSQEEVMDLAQSLAGSLHSANDPDFDEYYVANLQKVTAAQIRAAARKYFIEPHRCVAVVAPKGRDTTPAPKAAPEVLPATRVKLANGITLLLRRNSDLPTVSLTAIFRGGLRLENEQNNGIGQFLASMLRRGTTTRTALQVEEAFDRLGAGLRTYSGNNTFGLRIAAQSKHLAAVLQLLADLVRRPRFDPTEIEKMRRRILGRIRRRNDDPLVEAEDLLRRTFFTVSPYRLPIIGTAESVKRITRDDLVKHHQRLARPDNLVLAIYGDIDPAAAQQMVEKAFAGFESRAEVRPPAIPTEPERKEPVRAVQFTDREKRAEVLVGYPGVRFHDLKDRPALEVMDAILSGIDYPGGWLHRELRGRGLVYAVHAFNLPGLESALFQIAATTDQVDTTLAVILRLVHKMRLGEFTNQEFERAKKLCITARELRRETNADQAMSAALDEIYGIGYDYGDKYAERIAAVTAADVKQVAKRIFTVPTIVITRPKSKE